MNSGDAWVEGPNGERFWGRFGAAGLLVHDARRGVLLQHRADWSHFGGTWGLPGGARHEGETAVEGALRLLDSLRTRLERLGFRVLSHADVPPNDGGVSFGQAAVAAARLACA